MLVTDKVICDCCDKELEKLNDESFNSYGNFFPAWFREYFVLKTTWGYNSYKDMDTHEAVICESCYDRLFKDVKIRITGPYVQKPPNYVGPWVYDEANSPEDGPEEA